jgi:hypothetical protein
MKMVSEYLRGFPDMFFLLMQLKIAPGFPIAYPERGFIGRGAHFDDKNRGQPVGMCYNPSLPF